MLPTHRPESDLPRRTVRVLVLPAPIRGGYLVRFALRLGADGWVEVAESLVTDPAAPPDPAANPGTDDTPATPTGEPASSHNWPMLLRGLDEAEAIVCARHARRQREESGEPSPASTAYPSTSVRPEGV